jgi:hypothetical protein
MALNDSGKKPLEKILLTHDTPQKTIIEMLFDINYVNSSKILLFLKFTKQIDHKKFT